MTKREKYNAYMRDYRRKKRRERRAVDGRGRGRPQCELTKRFIAIGLSKEDAMREAHRERERRRYREFCDLADTAIAESLALKKNIPLKLALVGVQARRRSKFETQRENLRISK